MGEEGSAAPAVPPLLPPPLSLLPSLPPSGALIWFLAILAPFYGAINALYASLAIPYLGFVLPSIAMLYHYKSRAQLENSVLRPFK